MGNFFRPRARIHQNSRILLMVMAVAASATGLLAQGGPPMVTDDPGTPGPGRWELNFSSIAQRTAGETELDLPFLDLNYGVGQTGQVTWQIPWVTDRPSTGPDGEGLGASLVGFKWRFCDEGDKGWQVSTFPQVTFLNPGSGSGRRGLAAEDPGLLLPVEAASDRTPWESSLYWPLATPAWVRSLVICDWNAAALTTE